MPKAVHELAKKLKGKKGVENPFAMANAIMKRKGKPHYARKGKAKSRG